VGDGRRDPAGSRVRHHQSRRGGRPGVILIGLDWGTSALRAYLLDGAGKILDSAAAPLGILKVPPGGYPAALDSVAGPWLDAHPEAPVIACGMVGSKQGWREAPYVSCPAGLADLAGGLIEAATHRGRPVRIVPGVSLTDADGVPDVMRGEETKICGAGDGVAGRDGLFVLPGTHSKWARLQGGRITWFASFMTGELFAVLGAHSILGRLMEGDAHDAEAFRRGVVHALAQPGGRGGLLHRLFSARTLGLFDLVPRTGVRSYLSGLLIGSEAVEARAALGVAVPAKSSATVALIGSARLVPLYAEALALAGFACSERDEQVAARGLRQIAQAAGLA
jgi:2-dehydro-3-deoxygalactonokinase